MKANYISVRAILLIRLFLIVLFFSSGALPTAVALQGSVHLEMNQQQFTPHETVELEFHIAEETDLYYLGGEVLFDTSAVRFVEILPGPVVDEGLSVANEIVPGRVGASVSRTGTAGAQEGGAVMILQFTVKAFAPPGSSALTVENLEATDSENSLLELDPDDPAEMTVISSVSRLELEEEEGRNVVEGDLLDVSGMVYVNGVTDTSEGMNPSVTVWAGLNSENTSPSSWEEGLWQQLFFHSGTGTGFHRYAGSIAAPDAGTYYLALRARYGDSGYKYGGLSQDEQAPFWNGEEHTFEEISVGDRPVFRHTIAEWNFDSSTIKASGGLPGNRGRELYLVGVDPAGFASGASGLAASARGWEDPVESEKYWMAHLSTLGVMDLRVSSQQYGSSTGPRSMRLEASTDGEDWQAVEGGSIAIQDNWSSGILSDVPLDPQFNDREEIYLRWVVTEDSRISDSTEIAPTGTNRIDNISITGANLSPRELNVWPGDSDNDGQVNEADVLPLATYWLSEGPQPLFRSTAWEAHEVESWIPEEATYADSDGNGIVDHRDLRAIGYHYGRTRSEPEKQAVESTPSFVRIERLQAGESKHLHLYASPTLFLTGISFSLEMENIPAGDYSVHGIEPGSWAYPWQEEERLLEFYRANPVSGEISAAFSHKGLTPEVPADHLFSLKITAEQDWSSSAQLNLKRLRMSNRSTIRSISEETELVLSEEAAPESGKSTGELLFLQNYPNPADDRTTIRYWTTLKQGAMLELFDRSGRLVQSIILNNLGPGYVETELKTGHLAAGLYFYRLRYETGSSQTKKLTIIHP